MTWTLIIYIYAGVLARGDSVTLTQVDGFSTKQMCQESADLLEPLVSNSAKEIRTVCIPKR